MSCTLNSSRKYYDLQVLNTQMHALDKKVQEVVSNNQYQLNRFKKGQHIENVFDVTEDLVLHFKTHAHVFIENVLNRKEELGYLYNAVENKHMLDPKVYIPYYEFPFVSDCQIVVHQVKRIARDFFPEDTENFCVTMLYLLIFYCLLVNNDHMNWVTVEYMSDCNRYHGYAIHVNWRHVPREKLTEKMTCTIK